MHRDLYKLLQTSELEAKDKTLFLGVLSGIGREDEKNLIALFRQDPASVAHVFNNMEAKRKARVSRSVEEFEKAVDEEKAFLQGLSTAE
jgi:hypothetical protein